MICEHNVAFIYGRIKYLLSILMATPFRAKHAMTRCRFLTVLPTVKDVFRVDRRVRESAVCITCYVNIVVSSQTIHDGARCNTQNSKSNA